MQNGGDWWRDTEFLCPATLRAVCNLATAVNQIFLCMFFSPFCMRVCVKSSHIWPNFKLLIFQVKEYEDKIGKMEKKMDEQTSEIKELKEKVNDLENQLNS